MNAKLYNNIIKNYRQIKKEVYGHIHLSIDDHLNALGQCIEGENERSIYDAIHWMVETGRICCNRQEFIENSTGGQLKKMFTKCAKMIGDDLSNYKARTVFYQVVI